MSLRREFALWSAQLGAVLCLFFWGSMELTQFDHRDAPVRFSNELVDSLQNSTQVSFPVRLQQQLKQRRLTIAHPAVRFHTVEEPRTPDPSAGKV